jgi:endonuclease/exonuclease/phosphatase family metal-dependent hydrolase
MQPLRINLITCNIWNTERWNARAATLRKFLELYSPDVLCVQELRQKTRIFLDKALTGYSRVQDSFVGWTSESNIYWRATMFSEIEHGAEDVKIKEKGHRALFWARLAIKDRDRSMLVATAHLTHQRHPDESATGHNTRIAETRRIIAALKRLNRRGEPLFFMGDFNDAVHPTNMLHKAGYVSSFAALGLQPPQTFKCYPTAAVEPGMLAISQCIDWIVSNGEARPIATSVPNFLLNDCAPSDHWPVQAIYEIE